MTVKRNKKFKEHLIQQLQNQQQRIVTLQCAFHVFQPPHSHPYRGL